MRMLKTLVRTDNDYATLVLRLMLGVVFLPHGAQKALGWFGGHGFSGTMGFFTGTVGLPWIVAFLVIAAEFLGSLGLLAGFLTRVAAFGIGCVMAGAAVMVHAPHGFFMNWFGSQQGEGFEYHLLAIGMAVALMIRGAGALSVDGVIARNCGA
jgi:putative oxidoreductase